MKCLKRRLVEDAILLGSWITLAHPAIAEIMARSGFDWLAVDLEHSVITIREAEELIRVIDLCGVTPLVRVTSNDSNQIKRIMDAGAHGVIVPMVNCREDAERSVRAVKYPPLGKRGVGLARAQAYGFGFNEYKDWLMTESVVLIQIEHIEAVENLDAILSVEGIDGFIVGPYDLSGSLGVPGDFEHSAMLEALHEIRRIASAYKTIRGYHVVPPHPDLVQRKVEDGYRLIAYSVDILFLGEMCRNGLQKIRNKLT